MSDERKRPPAAVGDVLASVLSRAGLTERVAQAAVIPEWPALVGAQIAAVTDSSTTALLTVFYTT